MDTSTVLRCVPVSLLQKAVAINKMLKKYGYSKIGIKTEVDETDLKYLLKIHKDHARKIDEFMKVNNLSNKDTAKILKMDILVLNDYLELLKD